MKNTILTRTGLAAAFFAAVLAVFVFTGCPNLAGVLGDDDDSYTVTFDSRGGSSVDAVTVNEGARTGTLQEPSKAGYTFAGWYVDPEGTTAWADGAVTGNITLYAKWTQKAADGAGAAALRDAGTITVAAGEDGTGGAEIVFNTDNTVSITIGGDTKSYSYKVTEDAVIITKADGGEVSVAYEIAEDGTLSISGLDKIDESLPAGNVEPETEKPVVKPADKAVTPTATPGAGEVASGTTVTLGTTTEGAAIYYTTDGSEPSGAKTEYTAPISITSAVTIKAIAIKAGWADSGVLTAVYTIAAPGTVAKPTADPAGGEVTSGTTVTLGTTTEGAAIY
jgi:uncharacterized repeat protein (TIGR02543 family)